MAMACVLCLSSMPQTTMRRRLYSSPSTSVRKQLNQLIAHFGHSSSILPPDPGTGASPSEQPYLCRPCFCQVERVVKLRGDLSKVEAEIAKKLHHCATVKQPVPSTCDDSQEREAGQGITTDLLRAP